MNKAQRIIVIVYCIAVALACFYVPWYVEFPSRGGGIYRGYHLLIGSKYGMPRIPDIDKGVELKSGQTLLIPFIYCPVVVLEILGITAMGGMAFTLAGGFRKKTNKGKK